MNVVLATDIFDKELGDLRKKRWDQAFSTESTNMGVVNHDLRATIVLEHIIQASDVSHTMQHWHIYRKWNTRLFHELYRAYKAGRMAKDPSTFWYAGELGFFDNYGMLWIALASLFPVLKIYNSYDLFVVLIRYYGDYVFRVRTHVLCNRL